MSVSLSAVLLVAAAVAQPVAPISSRTPYDIDPVPHGVATGAMFGILAMSEGAAKPSMRGGFTCRTTPDGAACNPDTLNVVDRTVVGNNSAGWRLVSDVAGIGALVLPLTATLVDSFSSDSPTPLYDASIDALVIAESVAAATLLTHAFKYAVRRPRPLQYTTGARGAETQMSFPSGHSSSAAAATTAYAMTFALRHPNSPWRWFWAGTAVGITGLTSYGRVGGGKHFYSDVVAGAFLGGALGFLLPYLHQRDIDFRVAVGDVRPLPVREGESTSLLAPVAASRDAAYGVTLSFPAPL